MAPKTLFPMKRKHDIQKLIGNTLRRGVTLACMLALVGGVLYLVRHGAEPMPDYSTFRGADPSFTTLGGILGGLPRFEAREWIQLGVIALILTPILRVALSLVDFIEERDWLFAAITATVLAVIVTSSLATPL